MSAGHVLPLRTYFGLFFALIALTGVTYWVAFQDLGAWSTAVAMSIAMFKAALVVLYFMHVKYSSKLVWIFIGAGIYWIVIFFGFLMTDYFTRIPITGWGG